MKKIIICTIILVLIGNPLLYAAPKENEKLVISDVTESDPAYRYIANSINNGYLALLKDKTFSPDQPISRRDMSIILDKLLLNINEKRFDLSAIEIQELTLLAKNFKAYIVDNDSSWNQSKNTIKKMATEQEAMNNDINKLTEEIQSMKKQHDQEMIYIISGGVVLLVIALFVH